MVLYLNASRDEDFEFQEGEQLVVRKKNVVTCFKNGIKFSFYIIRS